MATTILPYENLGETLGVSLDLAHVPHTKISDHSFLVDRAQAGDSIDIGIEVQIPGSILDAFPPSERSKPPLEILATVTSIDGGIRQPTLLKQKKQSLYGGIVTLDLTRITEAAQIGVYAVRSKDCSSGGFASRKGSRIAWATENEFRFAERPPKGNFLKTVWEDFSNGTHVPRHFDSAMYFIDSSAEPPVLYLNKMASAPLIKLLETEGHGHSRALPRDLIHRSIAANVWMTLAQVTLEALHTEAVATGIPINVAEVFEGSWKKEMVELLVPSLYPNLMAEDALLDLGSKIDDKGFYADALHRAQLAIQTSQTIREHYEQFAEKVFENG